MPALKLEDLLNTPTGQQMLAEHSAREEAQHEQEDTELAGKMATWLEERDAALAEHAPLQAEALALVERLADLTKQLVPLVALVDTRNKYLLKNGYDGEYARCNVEGQAAKTFVEQMRYVEQYLRRALLASARMLVH